MQPSAKFSTALSALPLLLLAACTETADVPQTSLRDPRAAVGLSWCRSSDGGTITARSETCATGSRAVDRVAVADARLRAALLLNANLDLPRFTDLSEGTPGNTGIPLAGGPTRLAATGIPGVAVAALADDQWTRNPNATPAATGLVAFDAVTARAISDLLPTSSLPGDIATATGGGTAVWVSLPAESAVQRFDLTWSCLQRDGSRLRDCGDTATWSAGPRIAVDGPAALQLSADGQLFVARADGLGVEVFDTAGDCEAQPCALGRFVTAPSCADGLDDDGDGRTDADDPQCFGPNDNETGDVAVDDATSCINGVDDNGDGLVDSDDPNCRVAGAADGIEAGDFWGPQRGFFARREGLTPTAEGSGNCGDGLDNDGDGGTDRRDPTCFRFVKDESGPVDTTPCTDGLDNDSNGQIDADDPGCLSATDAVEGSGTARPSCANDLDDDSDGLTDELDEDCAAGSGDERPATTDVAPAPSGSTACADGLDNDGDGAVDWPADGGCRSADDTSETQPTACSDGLDNDGDGNADWPADPDCFGPNDTTETRPRSALLGPMTLSPDDRVLVVSEQLSRSLLFFDTLRRSRLEASPGDPNRRQLGLGYPAAGVVTAITAIRESEKAGDGATLRERFSVHATLSGSAGFSVYTHGRDLTRNTTYPLFSPVDSNDSSASIGTLQCGTGGDAPGAPAGSFAICSASSAAAPVLWSEEDGRIALPERWRYAVSTDELNENAFDVERDDARMPDTAIAGLTWRFTAGGELPWTARADGHFVSDATSGRWAVLAGNDACALPDLCDAFEPGLCPTLDTRCSDSPDTAKQELCGDPSFDFCRTCPALCSSAVSLCEASVRPGDILVLERIPALDERAALTECRAYVGRASTAQPLPPDLRFNITAVTAGRLALAPISGGVALPPASCFPHGFGFRILARSGWVSRLDDITDRPTGLGSPTEASEFAGECIVRPAVQGSRTRFAPGERIRHTSGLGLVLPAEQPQGTEIRFGLTAAALSPQFAVGATTVALTYLPEQNLLFVTDAATATVQARYGLQVSGHSNFEPLDYALP